MSTKTNAAIAAPTTKTTSALQPLLAVICGLFIVGFVGFSHMEAAHNAAHDYRHSMAFPCH